MSSDPTAVHLPQPTLPPSPTATHPHPAPQKREIKLISHSNIFYWWPIWVLGYVLALITYFEDHRMAILPANSKVEKTAGVGGKPDEYVISAAGGTKSLDYAADHSKHGESTFKTRISQKTWMGPVYCTTLILTILITNIPLRGLWSFMVILMMVLVALVFTVFNVWEELLGALGNLHIYINFAGYLYLATVVFILWAVSVFIFDQRTYIVFTPGRITQCEHIGASIKNYGTGGMTLEKQRDDLFRHWILGFFSGDLIVHTAGADRQTIRLPNVLWIGWRLQDIQRLMSEVQVVSESPN